MVNISNASAASGCLGISNETGPRNNGGSGPIVTGRLRRYNGYGALSLERVYCILNIIWEGVDENLGPAVRWLDLSV